MAAIVGAAGLAPTLAAARAGKQILLANKEALVMSGALFMDAVGAQRRNAAADRQRAQRDLPVPAARLCARDAGAPHGVAKILLTASGGPFPDARSRDAWTASRRRRPARIRTGSMGRKISVDSATMMNKGLEVIEAHWLFGASADQIEVVIHPQSVIHSMVSYVDGSVLAQLGNPDMRTPIAHALAYPERIESGVAPARSDADRPARTSRAPDFARFPCLRLAYRRAARGRHARRPC